MKHLKKMMHTRIVAFCALRTMRSGVRSSVHAAERDEYPPYGLCPLLWRARARGAYPVWNLHGSSSMVYLA